MPPTSPRRVLLLLIVCLPAFAQDKEKPRVLLLGGAIYNELSRGAAAELRDRVELVYPRYTHDEVIDTKTALAKLDQWLGEKEWDLIHFNFGLGDLVHRAPGVQQVHVLPRHAGGVRNTPPDVYQRNLEAIVTRLKATKAKLVWASTTPIRSSATDIFEPGSAVEYNAIAAKVMKKHGVVINDMHPYARGLIDMNKPNGNADPFHFDRKPLHPPIVRVILAELGL